MATPDNHTAKANAVLGVLVALGLLGAGYFVSNTLYKGRLASNTVTVKGFAERDVRADLALWQISYSVTGDDLNRLHSQSNTNEAALAAFLMQKGFSREEIRPGDLHVTDLLANEYRSNNATADQRYILKNTVTVRSNKVGLVDQTTHALNDLMAQGIVLTGNNVDFEFTKLNDIKKPVLRAATENAREAAQQFASDAGSTVGSIQSANQGFFSVVSRDTAAAQNTNGEEQDYASHESTIDKRVRVVVTLTYYLDK
ncbi:MAG: SIMPL domain-containing protein [Alphaproteobacteria bacterium]|nr:SIMPL domain-containing protein [Alphaproteobacteria bacterium]MBV9062423.1 SIMPL domain-containing protein [Alphaproteobacteria bacterium]